jgi:hypothetical protein
MNKINLKSLKENDAWVFYREDLETIKEGHCNAYFLLDAYSGYCFSQAVVSDLPSKSKLMQLLKDAHVKSKKVWPKQIWIAKNDPFADRVKEVCDKLAINFVAMTLQEIKPFVQDLVDTVHAVKTGDEDNENIPLSDVNREELEYFIPETYGPCPCASGKKFKFCCQPIFKDICFAMCGAEEGNLNEALHFMKEAESKVGQTAEVLCRYSIVWSFFDKKKSKAYLDQAQSVNPKHPRLNYVLGLTAAGEQQDVKAIEYYQKAIDNYPKSDRFHLNETYNNLGTAYYRLKKYQEAKEAWEKGFVLLPTDEMILKNLVECIYYNLDIPEKMREISTFIEKLFKSKFPR